MSGCEIDYVCVAPAHLTPAKDSSDTLLYNGDWAYCHAGVRDGHEWRRIVPMTIEEVRREREVSERRARI